MLVSRLLLYRGVVGLFSSAAFSKYKILAAGAIHTFEDGDVDPELLRDTSARISANILLFIILVLVVVTATVLLLYVTIRKRMDRENGAAVFFSSSNKVKLRVILVLYKTFDNFLLTHRFINRLKIQFEMIMPGDVKFAKQKALQTAVSVWGISFAVIIFVLFMQPTVYLVACACITVFVASSSVVAGMVTKNEVILLKQLQYFIRRVRYYYLTSNMLDEAVYDAIGDVPPLMQAHAKMMLDVLQAESDQQDEMLLQYKNAVPNRFLKQFLAICLTTMVNGDKKINKQSLCSTNMRNLTVDIDIELRRRREIAFIFSGLNFICIAPIYTLQLVSNWAVSQLTSTQSFYFGNWGAIIEVLCFVITIVCYVLLSRMRDDYFVESSEHYFLRRVCDMRIVRKFTNNYWNKNYGKKLRVDRVLRQTGSKIAAEHFLIQQLVLMLTMYVAVFVVAIVSNNKLRQYTVEDYTTVADANLSGTEVQYLIMMIMSKYYFDDYLERGQSILELYNEYAVESGRQQETEYTDAVEMWFTDMLRSRFLVESAVLQEEEVIELVHQYNRVYSGSTRLDTVLFGTSDYFERIEDNRDIEKAYKQLDDIRQKASELDPLVNTSGMYSLVSKTVYSKMKTYYGAYFKWYYVLIAFIAGTLGFQFPWFLLKFRMKELQVRMEDEVIQFQAIILLLIYFDDVNVLTILEWMNMFADIFADSISKCITAFEMDEEAALRRLEEDEPFDMFTQLVENLQMVDNVGVLQAFNELESLRISYQEMRAQENKISVESKSQLAKGIAFVPMGFVIYGFLVGPLIIASLSQFSMLSSEMANME